MSSTSTPSLADYLQDGQGGSDLTVTPLLTGLGYNSSTGSNYIETVDPKTGQLVSVTSFGFNTGALSTLTTNQKNAFVLSSSGLIYDINLSTGLLTTEQSSGNLLALSNNGNSLIGLGYNGTFAYIEDIDPSTGQANTVAQFRTLGPALEFQFFTISQTTAFVETESNQLYEINLSTGATAISPFGAFLEGLSYNGKTLVGIGYNVYAHSNYVETIDPLTGQTALVTSFTFDTDVLFKTLTFTSNQTDAFVESSSGLLYDIDLSTGAITTLQSDPALLALSVSPSNGVACFLRGTLIETPMGDVAIETLKIGDLVVAAGEHARPVRWIGHRSYSGRFLAANPKVEPIRIHTNALGFGLPRRDLFISPEHAVFLDGYLVPARHLVNDSSIVQVSGLQRVEYYHIELDSHDIILAEGAPSETFLDDNSRGMFHNASEHQSLYPTVAGAPNVTSCAPRLSDGYELEAIRQKLARLSETLPHAA